MTAGPTIVLLPGLDGTGRMFAPFVDRCPAEWDTQVVRYPRDPQLGYAELLPLVLDSLPNDRPYILLGESFSGPLAVEAATRDLPGLRGVILCASFVRSPALPCFQSPAFYGPTLFALMMHVEAAVSRMLGFCTRDLHHQVRESEPDVCPRLLSARVIENMMVDGSAALQRIAVPLLYLGAKWYIAVPARCRKLIEQLRPDITTAVLPASHRVLQNCPDEAWAALRPWLTQCLGPSALASPALARAA
jgi:pimeloyl-[acyl-carrier protein] methyl ester esterase